jgi:hypothetical protein
MWGIAIVAAVILMEHGKSVRGLFPILFGGVAVACATIGTRKRQENESDD